MDPKTVVLSRKLDANQVGTPKPAAALVPGKYNYSAKIRAGAQRSSVEALNRDSKDNGGWTAIDTMESPMGAVTDTAVLDKDTLVLRKREVRQGPMTIQLGVDAANKATGTMSMNGSDKPLSVDLGGPLFADAAGSNHVIAALPLAEGYSATFRNLDLQKQKVRLMQLKVAGSEQVTVPGGTFEAGRCGKWPLW